MSSFWWHVEIRTKMMAFGYLMFVIIKVATIQIT